MQNRACLVLLLITVMIGTGWTQTTAGQAPVGTTQTTNPAPDTTQTPNPAAPAFGQDNPAPQVTVNPPLSSLDQPVFEPGSDVKNFLQPGLQVSESLDTNAAGDFSNPKARSVTRLLGSLAMQRIWNRYDAGLDYVGGAGFYTAAWAHGRFIHSTPMGAQCGATAN